MSGMDLSKCCVYLKTVQTNCFKVILDVLKESYQDVTMTFDSSGLKICCIDPSRTALLYVKLNAEFLEEYLCEVAVDICVNVPQIYKLVKTASNHDELCLYLEQHNSP